jgi:alpha-D-ribose 1-methylphosphonate 5-triphosphate synthase subunit PhnG
MSSTLEPPVAERSQWIAALSRVPADQVLDIAERLAERYHAEHRQVPKAGLALLALQDAVINEPFYLGEIPLSSAVVELVDEQGRRAVGAAQVMIDDARLAAAMAVCDAVSASGWPGAAEVGCLIAQGQQAGRDEGQIRQSMLRRTRVDFSLLGEDTDPNS